MLLAVYQCHMPAILMQSVFFFFNLKIDFKQVAVVQITDVVFISINYFLNTFPK